jgi:hypothetical protein
MTPKEKAIELYDKFIKDYYIGKEPDNIKQCALIVVEEILDQHNSYYDTIGENLARIKYNYWSEVKQELEKM